MVIENWHFPQPSSAPLLLLLQLPPSDLCAAQQLHRALVLQRQSDLLQEQVEQLRQQVTGGVLLEMGRGG